MKAAKQVIYDSTVVSDIAILLFVLKRDVKLQLTMIAQGLYNVSKNVPPLA